jgi:magnesium-protoporphyrin O-methyltransferase
MRETLLSWLPADMTGLRLLDAGCGTGALAVEAARRGASVVAIDLAASLVEVARERSPAGLAIDWRVGDMRDAALGMFDHVVAMDSLIHYRSTDLVELVETLTRRTRGSMLFTFAPSTRPLVVMHAIGTLFPRADRAPAIEPVRERVLRAQLQASVGHARIGRDARVASGFYTSHALEMIAA